MRTLIDIISEDLKQAFVACGYAEKYGQATVSNRLICVSISVTVPWQLQKNIKKRLL